MKLENTRGTHEEGGGGGKEGALETATAAKRRSVGASRLEIERDQPDLSSKISEIVKRRKHAQGVTHRLDRPNTTHNGESIRLLFARGAFSPGH